MKISPVFTNPETKPLIPEVKETTRTEMQDAAKKQFEQDIHELLEKIKSQTPLDVPDETKELAQKVVDMMEEPNFGLLVDVHC